MILVLDSPFEEGERSLTLHSAIRLHLLTDATPPASFQSELGRQKYVPRFVVASALNRQRPHEEFTLTDPVDWRFQQPRPKPIRSALGHLW
jgi:hypothetical protein